MSDDLLITKTATIARCIERARDELAKDPATFDGDITRQDAATLNVLRAWEAAVEMGDYIIGAHALGVPADERAVMSLLSEHGWIDAVLAEKLQRSGEFCRAEWDYQAAPLAALVAIIERDLDDFLALAQALLARESVASPDAGAPLP
ncbi:MAG: hypothetical protein H7335_09005 [Massilia sp.]|nr:hypothetical protein [Massilia sp.]